MEALERIRELLQQPIRDGLSGRAILEAIRPLVIDLIETHEKELGRDGGEFGRQILGTVEKQVLSDVNGRLELSDRTTLVSCSTHVVSGAVYVDVRIKVDPL